MTETNDNQITAEKVNSFVYKKTTFNVDGWADASKHKPIPFDLVVVHTTHGREHIGWWNQESWDGLYLNIADKIDKWKRRKYEKIC